MRDRLALIALSVWTLFVWVGRVRNVLAGGPGGDGEFTGWSFTWRLLVAVGFAGAGLALGVFLIRDRNDSAIAPLTARFALLLAAVGSVWWFVRGAGILAGDYAFGFKVVHSVLAVVTIVVSALVLRSLAPGATDRYHPHRYG